MRIEGHKIRMLATNGDHRLGGKDWDDVIVNYVAEEFDREHGENPLLDLQSYQDLQVRALNAKIQLSSRPRTSIVHSFNGKSLKVELTREEFALKTRHLLEKCKTICEMTMQESRLEWKDLDKILMVGGMTRMPMVREMMTQFSPVPTADDVNPDEAVAIGASVQAILLMLQEEQDSGESVLPENTRQQFSSREGGLIQVSNITSHTLGVVLWDEGQLQEYVFPMINKMSPIPALAKNFFGTANANMPRAVVRIVEGESTLPVECTALGTCGVELPPFLPKGSPVELVYQYNQNQILEVEVHAGGRQTKVSIERNTGLAPHEVEKARAGLAALTVS